jgi:uncharacterized protein (TIGR00369 family)
MTGNEMLPPYARALNMQMEHVGGAAPLLSMPFSDIVQGRPGFLHGGAISGLLEMAAVAAIHHALRERGSDAQIKQVNVTVDFMRGGVMEMTYAVGIVTRLGRTMANVDAHAWQGSGQDKPIAIAHMHYLIKGNSEN